MNDTYITLTGWVGSDVSLREVVGGHAVANFRVATTARKFRNNQWEDGATTWYSVTAWRRLADNVAASISRGDPVVVHGRLEADVWTKQDGSSSTQLVITASSVGHDLSRGKAVFTKPAPVQADTSVGSGAPNEAGVTGQMRTPGADPWAVPLEPRPDIAQEVGGGAVVEEGGAKADAA